ncbi:PepSY domain-containing protein [Mesobacillus foraminis]|uniref:PepSY domain-containing protein n=1 Tax=Mesobacillus foraminis TaxID=279826 RepID=UPI001BE77E06|nr:PepSY domain-containing protein [Mesobacillus foraminis]MBT2758346.1 PepSY domain-containing protein [Mesobacillus foraminis]
MKRNILIAGVAGIVLLGGAVGAGAFDDRAENTAPAAKKTENAISMEKAEEIAVKEAGGTVEKVEYDKDDSREIYEVELRSDNGNDDTDVKIHAVTGEVISIDRDDDDDDDDDNKSNVQNTEVKLSKDEVIAIAVKETPGKVVEFEFDRDDLVYELEVKTDKSEVDYEIDANTGKILEKDTDDDQD